MAAGQNGWKEIKVLVDALVLDTQMLEKEITALLGSLNLPHQEPRLFLWLPRVGLLCFLGWVLSTR